MVYQVYGFISLVGMIFSVREYFIFLFLYVAHTPCLFFVFFFLFFFFSIFIPYTFFISPFLCPLTFSALDTSFLGQLVA